MTELKQDEVENAKETNTGALRESAQRRVRVNLFSEGDMNKL